MQCIRTGELMQYLFDRPAIAVKAGRIVDGILAGGSARLSDIAQHMPGAAVASRHVGQLLHRLLLANLALLWLAALTAPQAHHDLPQPTVVVEALATTSPNCANHDLLDGGPALPPPVQPHRGPAAAHPHWLRRFALRGPLSYVRLGLEIMRLSDLTSLVRRSIRWLGHYLWQLTPFWSRRQQYYRLKHWRPLPT